MVAPKLAMLLLVKVLQRNRMRSGDVCIGAGGVILRSWLM